MISGPEFVDLLERVLPSGFARAARRQHQAWAVVGATQLGRHQQNLVPQRLERRRVQFWGEAKALEPVDQVVGQQQEMKVGLVREEVRGGDVAEAVVALELPDDQLD